MALALTLVVSVLTMAACAETGGAGSPRIDSISATLVGVTVSPTPTTTAGTNATATRTATATPTATVPVTTNATGVGIRINITTANFRTVSPTATPIATATTTATTNQTSNITEGYYIYYFDMLPATLSQYQQQIPQAPEQGHGLHVTSADTSITWANVPSGIHIFAVQLVDRNGQPMAPANVAAIVISVPRSLTATATPAPTR